MSRGLSSVSQAIRATFPATDGDDEPTPGDSILALGILEPGCRRLTWYCYNRRDSSSRLAKLERQE